MSKVVIYVRVSTKEQAEEGNSLVTQERLCRDYAGRNELDVERIFIEQGESAKTANRTRLREMMEYCTKHRKSIDGLLIYRIDRLSRNTIDYANLKMFFNQLDIKVISITENLDESPVGRFVETTLASVSQLDNDIRAERSKNGMIDAVREGRWPWKAPLGYENTRVNGKKNIAPRRDEKQIRLLQRYWELIDNGLRVEPASRLVTQEGLRGNTGKSISKSAFNKMLGNPLYKGVINGFGLTVISESIESIIQPELFDRVQLRIKGKDVPTRKYSKANPLFPLRNILVCKEGHHMTGSSPRGNGGRYYKYHCARCRGKGTSHDKKVVEARFHALINGYEYQDRMKELLREAISVNWEYRTKSNRKKIAALNKEIAEIEAQDKLIVAKNLKGVYSDERTKDLLAENSLEITKRKADLNELQGLNEDVTEIVEFGFSSLQRIGDIWEELEDVEIKQRFQNWLFPAGLPYDGDKFGTTALPLCISIKKDLSEEKSLLVIPRRIELRLPG